MPTKVEKPKADEIYVCLWSFAGEDLSVAQGARYRGDNPIVQKFWDRFAPESTPDDELHRLRVAAAAPSPPPQPLGRVKLRVIAGVGDNDRQTVFQRGRTFTVGEEFEAEGADAQAMLDAGAAEIVRHLRPKQAAKAGFTTGREED